MPDEYTYEYETPDFLTNQDVDTIHTRMMDNLPDDITKEEGNIPWDFTRPAATEKAEFIEFALNETVKLIFPQWSYAEYLDLHGEKVNCIRREANKASGTLEVTGEVGTIIPSGFQFATPADLTESLIFETTESHILAGTPNADGMVTNSITVQAAEGGESGNVAADTIKLMVNPINNISLVTNPDAFSGGTAAEGDEEYLIRILDTMRSGQSMTGCNADYIRWGKEVAAVGQVIVDPEWNDPNLPAAFHYTDTSGNEKCAGAVRLIIIDSNGTPANQQILNAVYSHIAGTGDTDPQRLMPIGAHLTVQAPTAVTINITATLIIESGASTAAIAEQFKASLTKYWLEVAQEATDDASSHTGYIRIVQVGAILATTNGVVDYTSLKINGGTANIAITQSQYPVTGEVTLSE